MHSPTENNRGVTLVELVVGSAIGLVILGVLSSSFILQQRRYDVQEQITGASQTARAALDMMSRELRMAGYDPLATGFSGIVDHDNDGVIEDEDEHRIRALSDFRGDNIVSGVLDPPDGNPDDPNEDIVYAFDNVNNRITRNTGGGAQPFAENVIEFKVTYYKDNALNPASLTSEVRFVKIEITVRSQKPDPNTGEYHTVTLKSDIEIRNLDLVPAGIGSTSTTTTTTTTTTTLATTTEETTTEATITGETTTEATTTGGTTTEATITETSTTAASTTDNATTTIPDTSGPTISSVTQNPAGSSVDKNATPTICALISDLSGVVSVVLSTKLNDSTTISDSITMSDSGGGQYCGTIPKHKGDTVTYTIEATDSRNNHSTLSSAGSYFQPQN